MNPFIRVILSEAKDLITANIGRIRFFGLRPQNDIACWNDIAFWHAAAPWRGV